jgi:hypothetical protein
VAESAFNLKLTTDWNNLLTQAEQYNSLGMRPRNVGKSASLGMVYGMGQFSPPRTPSTGIKRVATAINLTKADGDKTGRWRQIKEWVHEHDMVLSVQPTLPFHVAQNLKHRGAPPSSSKRSIHVNVWTEDGTRIRFDEPLPDFPSEAMHAKLALTVAAGGVRRKKMFEPNMQMDPYAAVADAVADAIKKNIYDEILRGIYSGGITGVPIGNTNAV